jgi:hypothetical protein
MTLFLRALVTVIGITSNQNRPIGRYPSFME